MADQSGEETNEAQRPSFAARRPVLTTLYLWVMIVLPGVVFVALVGAPLGVVVGFLVVMSALLAYLANRWLKHPDDPGPIALGLQKVTDATMAGNPLYPVSSEPDSEEDEQA